MNVAVMIMHDILAFLCTYFFFSFQKTHLSKKGNENSFNSSK